jgi:hypothetical protein
MLAQSTSGRVQNLSEKLPRRKRRDGTECRHREIEGASADSENSIPNRSPYGPNRRLLLEFLKPVHDDLCSINSSRHPNGACSLSADYACVHEQARLIDTGHAAHQLRLNPGMLENQSKRRLHPLPRLLRQPHLVVNGNSKPQLRSDLASQCRSRPSQSGQNSLVSAVLIGFS